MILYRAPWYYYATTTFCLFLECLVIYGAPFILWAINVNWHAGETFMSEYSIVIGLRWGFVIIFQLPMLIGCFSTAFSAFNLVVHTLRKAALFAQKVQNSRSRNQDGTFASENSDYQSTTRRRGRPTKQHTS